MKAVYSLVLSLLLMLSTPSVAQTNDSAFVFMANQFDKQWTVNQFRITGDINVGSNTASTSMFSDFLFRYSFSEKSKNAFLETTATKANLSFGLEASAELKLSKKWGIYTANNQHSYFTLDNSLSKMLLFGNARFADKTITSKNSEILQASTAEIGLTHNTYNTDKWQVKTSLGIASLYNYANYRADLVELYTASDGSFIDFRVQNAAWVSKKSSKTGLGVNAGMDVSYKPSLKHNFTFSISDINVFNIPNGIQYKLDTSFRFEGVNYVFDKQSPELQLSADSAFDEILNRDAASKTFLVLPSNLALNWNVILDDKNQLGIGVKTIGFGEFGNFVGVNHDYTFSNKLRLRSSMVFGNFVGLQWNEAVEVKFNKTNIYLSAIGLNALITPLESHSYGLTAGISKLF